MQDPRHEPLTLPFERLGLGLTNGSWTKFGPIPCSPSIDKTLKIEPEARRDVLSTLCPLNVRSCVAGACTYLQQILCTEVLQLFDFVENASLPRFCRQKTISQADSDSERHQ